jgi:lipoprotein-anchoring transpeptidase ErfK/SrfK
MMRRLLGAGLIAALASAPAAAQLVVDARTARDSAVQSAGFRIIVSISARRLWVVDELNDTLIAARAAVGKGTTLRSGGRTWNFSTPRGVRVVTAKEADPIWVPPDWFYIEVARREQLKLAYLDWGRPVTLSDGGMLVVRDRVVGVQSDGEFEALPLDEHIVFDKTLFVPPMGTENRRILGTLGPFSLAIGDGFLVHGTSEPASIGRAATHGCIRLGDADITWLYENVPVGTRVYIY